MPELTKPPNTNEISLPKILREELNHIKNKTPPSDAAGGGRPSEKLNEVFADFHREKFSALCFSGGGIRSATFGLGIVQALAKHRLLDNFDYLSTVSGGGYLGSWLSAWIRREQMNKVENRVERLASIEHKISARLKNKNLAELKKTELELLQRKITASLEKARLDKLHGKIPVLSKAKNRKLHKKYNAMQNFGINAVQNELNRCSTAEGDCPNTEPKQLQHLREYSNFMSPRVGLLSADTWTFFGIYTRNLFLNWLIFVPLICAVLLIPRIFLALTNSNIQIKSFVYALLLNLSPQNFVFATFLGERFASLLLLCGLFAGIVAVIFTIHKFPSKKPAMGAVKFNTDAGVFLTVILPMLVMALAATVFWAWLNILKIEIIIPSARLKNVLQYESVNFVIFSVAVFVLGNITFYLYKFYKKFRTEKFDLREIERTLKSNLSELIPATLSSAVGGVLAWLIARFFFNSVFFGKIPEQPHLLPLYVCLAVPLYLLCYSISSTVFVGLYSRVATDEDREWLARQGAWVLIVCGAWIVLNGLVLFGPTAFQWLIDSAGRLISGKSKDYIEFVKDSIVPIIVAVSGFISLFGGFSGKSKVRDEEGQTNLSKFLAVAPKIAAVIFLGFIFIALGYVSSLILALVGKFLDESLGGRIRGLAASAETHSQVLNDSSVGYLLVWLVILSAIGIGMACFINVNKFSLHAAYRDRLIRAYLGASHVERAGNPFTGFDDADNFQLHRLKGQKPFHIINATLNLIAGSKLAWQNRKAASFTMSPLHCGSWLLGYRRTNEYCRNPNLSPCKSLRYCNRLDQTCRSVAAEDCQMPGKALRLGTAMTISGAAANPNMGYYSSPVVTFLMSLFNIRLGWWLGNTGKRGDDTDWWGEKFYTKPSPSIAVLPLLNETLGQTDEEKHFLNVTDGGHFENLGLYEMVLRRCHLIVLSDAAADENFTFGEISNAIEKCKVDLGVDIIFKDGINIYSRRQAVDFAETRQLYALAEIIYPERDRRGKRCRGHLLYIRPTFYGDESTDIKHYANSNRAFPHQSTADQLYDEKQFEAYRALGFSTMEKIFGKRQHNDLGKLFDFLRGDGIQNN